MEYSNNDYELKINGINILDLIGITKLKITAGADELTSIELEGYIKNDIEFNHKKCFSSSSSSSSASTSSSVSSVRHS